MEQFVSSSDLALVLKISSRRVNQLADEGVIFREENGKFDISKAVENFFRHKYRVDEAKDINFDKEHALFEKVKRKKAEIDLEEHKKTLLKASDVEHLMAGMILTCKARLLTLPTKVTPKIIGEKDPTVVVETIKDAVFEALNELKEIPAPVVVEADNAVDT